MEIPPKRLDRSAIAFVDSGFLRVTTFAQRLQICKVKPFATIVDRHDMIDFRGGGPLAMTTERVSGEKGLAELLPGAIIAPLGGSKLPWRLLAPGSLAVAVNRSAKDHD